MRQRLERERLRPRVPAPEHCHRIGEDARSERRLAAEQKPKPVATAHLTYQPELRQRRFQRVLVVRASRRQPRHIGPDEAQHIVPDRGGGRAGPPPLLCKLHQRPNECVALERRRRTVAERPKPSRVGRIAGDLPVHQPRRGGIFHVRVEATVIEQALTERCRRASILADNPSGNRPMPHRTDHVLSDTELRDRTGVGKDGALGVRIRRTLDSVVRLLEPAVTQRKRFVTRQSRPIVGFVQLSAHP